MNKAPGGYDFFVLGILSLIWGSSYILIKWGLEVFTPAQVATLRLGIAATVLAPFALRRLPTVERRRWPLLLLVGVTGTALTSYLFPVAQTRLSSSMAGMLSGLTPLFTFVLAWLFFSKQASGRQFLGVLVGLAGAMGIAGFAPGGMAGTTEWWYVGVAIVCCLSYALSGNLIDAYLGETPALTVSTTSFFLAGLPAVPFVFGGSGVVGAVVDNGAAGWWALGYVAFLAVFSTALCYLIFVKLVQRTGVVFASNVSYLIPVVALVLGVLDGEAFTGGQGLAVGMVLVGVWLSRGR